MKKFFTLVSLAAMALTANAQKVTWSVADVNDEGAALKSIIVNNEDPSQASTFTATEGTVTITGVSGPVSKYQDCEGTPGVVPEALEALYDNTWSGLKTQGDCANGPFYYVQGKGNPVDLSKVTIEEIYTDGEPTGKFRPNWDKSYYAIDGSNGLCSNGTYMTLTSTVAGKMTAQVWINKGTRDVYIVPASTKVALTPDKVTVAGYVNGVNNEEGKKMYFEPRKEGDMEYISYDVYDNKGVTNYVVMHHKYDGETMEEDGVTPKDLGKKAGQAMFLYITWDAAAGETYYIFNKNTQIGIGGFEFEGGAADDSQLVCKLKATPVAGYESTTGVTTEFEEWSDKRVIKAFDGKAGNDIVLTWDENGWSGVNGKSSNYVYYNNEGAPYVSALLYTGSYIGGSWNATDGGYIWIQGYFYTSYEDTKGTWASMYWTLSPMEDSSVEAIKDNSKTVAPVKRLTNRGIVIEKDGKKYSVAGTLVK